MRASPFTLLDVSATDAPLLDYLNMPSGSHAYGNDPVLESAALLQLFPPPPRYVVRQSFWERFMDVSEHSTGDHGPINHQ